MTNYRRYGKGGSLGRSAVGSRPSALGDCNGADAETLGRTATAADFRGRVREDTELPDLAQVEELCIMHDGHPCESVAIRDSPFSALSAPARENAERGAVLRDSATPRLRVRPSSDRAESRQPSAAPRPAAR